MTVTGPDLDLSLTRREAAAVLVSLEYAVRNIRDSHYTDPGKPARVAEAQEVLASVRGKVKRAKTSLGGRP